MHVLPLEQQSCTEFLRSVLRPKDLAFLINFDADIDLDQDFTNNVQPTGTRARISWRSTAALPAAVLPGLGGGPVPNAHPRSTALYDAIFLAADEKLKNEVGRKAMIVFTDGEDEGSRLRIKDAIEAAQKADTICYVILIADRGFYGGLGYSGDASHEEAGGRNRRTRHRSGQQAGQIAPGVRPDSERTAQPVQHRLHPDQQQARRHLP